MSLVLVLLAFVGWTGYRVALLGGTCLALAGGGLLLQELVGWMPADQQELLTYQFGTVVVAAVVAIPFGLRRRFDGFSGIVVAVVFAAASFVILQLVEPGLFLRIVLGALTAVLVLIALHIVGDLWMLRLWAAAGTYLPLRRMLRWSMLIAFAGVLVNAASRVMPTLWLAVSLLLLSFAGFVTALQLAAFVVILVRNGPFAQAWAKRWSRTRRVATVDLARWIMAGVGALTLLSVPVAASDMVRLPPPVTVGFLVAGAACVVTGGVLLRRLLDHASYHRFQPEPQAAPQVASALRGLVESEPVYRLLPGISRRW